MSIAEVLETPLHRSPVVPPRPDYAPPGMSRFGRIAQMRRSAIGTWGERAYREDIIKSKFLGRNSFTVNAPDAIKHVLIDNYENYGRTHVGIRVLRPILGEEGLLLAHGKAWKHQRRTLAPAFSPRAVAMLVPHMLAATDDMVTELAGKCNGGPADLREAMQRLALDIAGRTMFSFALDKHGPTLRDFVNDVCRTPCAASLPRRAAAAQLAEPARLQRAKLSPRVDAVPERADHRATGARRKRKRAARPVRPDGGRAQSGNRRGVLGSQLADQVATMILAGHETTATALFWSLYLLSLDRNAQEELAAEARATAHMQPGELDVTKLTFTRAVLDEAMRLYPPAFLIARAALGADTIAGESVQTRDVIMIAPWLLHRHEKLWENPNAFMPQRFLPAVTTARSLRLSAVRRRPAGLHRRAVRADRGDAGAGKDLRELSGGDHKQAAGDAGRRRRDRAGPFAGFSRHAPLI